MRPQNKYLDRGPQKCMYLKQSIDRSASYRSNYFIRYKLNMLNMPSILDGVNTTIYFAQLKKTVSNQNTIVHQNFI